MYIYTFNCFTTQCELHIGIQNKFEADNAASIVMSETKRLEIKYNYFSASSLLNKINNRTTNTIALDEESLMLLQLSLFYFNKTNGAFDIAKAGTLKNKSNIHEFKLFASSTNIKLKSNKLIFDNNFTKLDFGGVVKEYAVDKSIEILKQLNIQSALVNFGGDLATLGYYKNSKPWTIGIEDPNDQSKNITTIELCNNSLCTSGHTKRFTTINNKQISHIISDIKNNYTQVSIIAPTTIDAGIWSTALLSNQTLTTPSHIKVVNLLL